MVKIGAHELEYIFYHLNHHCTLHEALRKHFRFGTPDNADVKTPAVQFPLSDEFPQTNIIAVQALPVLFPMSDAADFYRFDGQNNLIFNHDLLTSAFYLLSGRQEYEAQNKDALGRFPYVGSIQHQHNFISKPVVNYYFEIIIQALEKFCGLHHIAFSRKKPFGEFAFFLTHDIDYVDEYHFWEVALKVKQLLVPKISPYSFSASLQLAVKSLMHYAGLWRQKNNFWNFDYLLGLEEKLDIKAAYYFLEKHGLHDNSRYHFSEERIKRLVKELTTKGIETGLHFNRQAAYDAHALEDNLKRYNASLNPDNKPVGGRYHTLQFELPASMNYLEKTGILYDSSLGFAAHEGFRNSYCFPFKLFDFEKSRMIDVWEVPLNIMDTTLFNYRKYTMEEAHNGIINLMDEVKKFGGVLTILWHNTFFDECRVTGITAFYESVLVTIVNNSPKCYNGIDIVSAMNAIHA